MIYDLLRQQLLNARETDARILKQAYSGQPLNVPKTGKSLTTAYEQLRNAAEYAEDHLLLQRAIRRFFKRNIFIAKPDWSEIGADLIIELVQAGYIADQKYGPKLAKDINKLAAEHHQSYLDIRQSRVPKEQAQDWILSILSVEAENMVNPHSHHFALMYVAHQHFSQLLPAKKFIENQSEADIYQIALYVAVHQALFKSDTAVVRHDLMRVYGQKLTDVKNFIELNRQVDKLYLASLTQKLRRIVSKNGAPLRILKSMCDDFPDIVDVLGDRKQFLESYSRQIDKEFSSVQQKVNNGIVKSIFFIIITKVIIGLAVEIPYDLITTGSIAFLPLWLNLATPPLYMASLKLGLKAPRQLSKAALKDYIDQMIYGNEKLPLLSISQSIASQNINGAIYSLLIFLPLGLMVYVLKMLDFSLVQMAIFFSFLSTASFLGFRLSIKIREVEFGQRQASGFIAALRDFFYLPFIMFGQWLSGKYAKINLVSNFLDVLIELPLKTILKLIRQWVRFVDQKQEEIS